MTPFFGFLTSKYSKLFLGILAALYLFSLWGRIPDIDDAWIGELAYFLSEEGQMRSELMRGVTLQEEKFVVNNKLFALTGALFINLFGFSLYVLKSVSLLWFVAFLLMFYAYVMKWGRLFDRSQLLFSLILIISFTYLFKFSFLFRPELMMMALGFGGYMCLEKYLKGNKTSWLLASGLLFGLTCATHLNGLILVVSAAVLLFTNKRFVPTLYFGAGLLVGFLPFFFDMTSRADFDLWFHQFFESPALDSIASLPVFLKPFYNLIREYIRYFYKIEIAVYSILMIVSLIVGFRYLLKKHRNLMLFALLNILFTGLIAMHKSQQYLLLNFPYIIILMTLTFRAVFDKKILKFRIGSPATVGNALVFLFVVFMLSSFYHNLLLARQKFSPDENRELTLKYAGEDVSKMNVVAPMTFIFNEVKHFNRIQGEVCYIELQKGDPSIFGKGVLKKAKTFEIDLLMITPIYTKLLGLSGFSKGDTAVNYQVIDKTDDLLVFKRIQD